MKKTKRLLSLSLALLLSTFSLGCSQSVKANVTTTAKPIINQNMKVHYIDVGQGDSELIQVEGKNILIDAGCSDTKAIDYLKSIGVTKLDYVIATHPHEDHIGGMTNVINSLDIGSFYAPKVTHTTKTFQNMVNSLKTKNLKLKTPNVGDTLTIGNATLQFLAPNSNQYKDINNYSIVIKLKYGNNSFIFTGDAEDVSEGEILAKQLDIQADVLKLGHHGSHSSTTQAFLNKVNPKYAIVSCGKDNDYGHPHKETLDKLHVKSISVFRTDVNGTIIATSNGTDITFNADGVNSTSATPNSGTDNSMQQESAWIANNNAKVYHSNSKCSDMKSPIQIILQQAKDKGLKACKKCY